MTPEAAGQEPLALAFGLGLAASLDLCGLALRPSALVYYLGAPDAGRRAQGRVTDGLAVGLVLTLGFVLVLGIVGARFAPGARAIVRDVVPG